MKKKEDKEDKEDKKSRFLKETLSWVKAIIIAFILSFFITNFIIVNAKVPTSSMENTISVNDRLIANRLSYVFSDPQRYDIVVFKYPDDESKLYLKRIIGLPGETVRIENGQVYINDSTEPLRDDFLPEEMYTEGTLIYEVPENCYFMLGDNRNYSEDSRYWENTFVSRDKILGKVLFKYFPKFEILTNK